MKLATILSRGSTLVAAIDVPNSAATPVLNYSDMLSLVAEQAQHSPPKLSLGSPIPLSEVALAAPIVPPRNIMCVGKNYHDHAREFAGSGFDASAGNSTSAIPDAPIIFTKPAPSVIGDGENILYPSGVSDCLDYEAELGVVIGRGGKGIATENALGHIFGYTIINDLTARDLQNRHKQWFIGKGLDTFCHMGPWITTKDEIDGANLNISCWVNKELRQKASTRELIFDIGKLIATISAGLTLQPDGIIATGTPAGVGIGFKPPRYLRVGDEVAIEIEGIGRLSNSVAR